MSHEGHEIAFEINAAREASNHLAALQIMFDYFVRLWVDGLFPKAHNEGLLPDYTSCVSRPKHYLAYELSTLNGRSPHLVRPRLVFRPRLPSAKHQNFKEKASTISQLSTTKRRWSLMFDLGS
jgi:hypothetical protein